VATGAAGLGAGLATPGGGTGAGRVWAAATPAGKAAVAASNIKHLRRKRIGWTIPFVFKDIPMPALMHTHDE
jgi:hypothetical protein